MTGLLLLLLLLVPLAAAQGPALPKPATVEPSEAAKPEEWLSGTTEMGYRWVSQVSGNFDTYRSIVNLGKGPKLMSLDWTARDRTRRLFDRIDFRAHSWGGDPYNSAQIEAKRDGTYEFSFDYRNIAYFNCLPSFANPRRDRGILDSQRTFDILRRTSDIRLNLRPGRKWSPYAAYSRSSGSGSGQTVFVSQGNEYMVPNRLSDHTNTYSAGIELDLGGLHATLEQGGTTLRDNQEVFNSAGNPGNVTLPLLGQQLLLTNLLQSYNVAGTSIYSTAKLTARPASWVDIYGQFLYSQPRVDASYSHDSRGNFVLFRELQFYAGEQSLISSDVRLPHSSASIATELRPASRARILYSWMTDRLHSASEALASSQFLFSAQPIPADSNGASDRFVWHHNQQEFRLHYDLTSKVVLKGGYRSIWGDASVRAGQFRFIQSLESGVLRQHVALGGIGFRAENASLSADIEVSPGDRNYFRTSLQQYRRAKIRGRYQMRPSFTIAADVSYLVNEYPAPAVRLDMAASQNSLSITWMPGGGKRLMLVGTYSRLTYRSALLYREPSTREADRSIYRTRDHVATGVLAFAPFRGGVTRARVSLGGAFYRSSGTRPASYYQPLAKLSIRAHKRVDWISEWRWHGLSQSLYAFEAFRAHLFLAGLRVLM